jgi:hypothetical protein
VPLQRQQNCNCRCVPKLAHRPCIGGFALVMCISSVYPGIKHNMRLSHKYAQNQFCGYREKRTKVRWSIPSVRHYKGNRVVIAGVCQASTPSLYRRLCAGHRRTTLVSVALRWSSPHRPCISGSALVMCISSVYPGIKHNMRLSHKYAQNQFCGYREKRTQVRWSIPSVRHYKGNRVVIAGVCPS